MRSVFDDFSKRFRWLSSNRIGLLILITFLLFQALIVRPSYAAVSAISNTTSVSGFLTGIKSATDLSLRIDPFSPPLKIEAHGSVRETLALLSEGSWIVGRGEVDHSQMSIRLVAIQTLGLKEILGAWTSSRDEIFVFRNFNHLLRYKVVKIDGRIRLQLMQKLEYALSPDAGHAYSIFITDDKKRIFFGILRVDGTIEINSAAKVPTDPHRTLFLTMYDSQTGTETQKFSLSPLLLK